MKIVALLMIFAFIQVEGRDTSLREAINLLRQAVRSKQLSLGNVVSNVDVNHNSGNVITAGSVGNVGRQVTADIGIDTNSGNAVTADQVGNVGGNGAGKPPAKPTNDNGNGVSSTVGVGTNSGNIITAGTVGNVGRGVVANVDIPDNSGNIITAGTVGNVASNVGRDVSEPEFLSKRIVVLGQKYQRNGDVTANVDVTDNSGNVITGITVGNVGRGDVSADIGIDTNSGNAVTADQVGNVGGNGAGKPPAKPTNDNGNGVSSTITVGGTNSGNIITADVVGDIGRNKDVNTKVNSAGARCFYGVCELCDFYYCFLDCC